MAVNDLKTQKKNNWFKYVIFFILAAIILAGILIFWIISSNSSLSSSHMNQQPNDVYPKPNGRFESKFLYQEVFYSCSKEIPGEWVDARVGVQGSKGYYFIPESMGDLSKFCRATTVIEYKSVIDILKREDVSRIIEKYDTTHAWVRALSHKYIEDKQYLHRILPEYRNVQIDCIIVVHSPEGTRFFIENGAIHESHDDHRYIEVEADKFLAALNNASKEDVTNFWLSLH